LFDGRQQVAQLASYMLSCWAAAVAGQLLRSIQAACCYDCLRCTSQQGQVYKNLGSFLSSLRPSAAHQLHQHWNAAACDHLINSLAAGLGQSTQQLDSFLNHRLVGALQQGCGGSSHPCCCKFIAGAAAEKGHNRHQRHQRLNNCRAAVLQQLHQARCCTLHCCCAALEVVPIKLRQSQSCILQHMLVATV